MFGILAIRLVALAVLYLLWVGQHYNEMTFQDAEHWNPVRASALHHYMRNPFRSEPLAQTHRDRTLWHRNAESDFAALREQHQSTRSKAEIACLHRSLHIAR